MANCKMVSFQQQPDGGAFCFQGVTAEMVASDAAAFFAQQGYRFEGGTPTNATYGTGSAVLRFFFGVFARRFKFHVGIQPQAQFVWLRLGKAMTGFSGGLIGLGKMKTEIARIVFEMQRYFA